MKNTFLLFVLLSIFLSCTTQKNSEDFINATSGRYLFNENEVLEIYFVDAVMHAKWRGNDDIELLKVNDSSFYMRMLNEKMLFVSKPTMHIELAPKTEHDGIVYHFKKMKVGEKTASEYFKASEYDKALVAFKAIQNQDSLSPAISQWKLNRLGYNFIKEKKHNKALEIFKINAALYPTSSNVYDSMGKAYLYKKDTVNAKIFFKKALAINSENRSAKRHLEILDKK